MKKREIIERMATYSYGFKSLLNGLDTIQE